MTNRLKSPLEQAGEVQQQADWIKERAAIRARVEAALKLHYCNKCGWFGETAEHAGCRYAAAPSQTAADLRALLSHADQDAVEIERLKSENDIARRAFEIADLVTLPNGVGEMNALQISKKLNELGAKLTLREQRISELEAASHECKCACHDDPKHQTVQDWAEANRYHVARLKDIIAERDELRKANEEELAAAWDAAFANTLVPRSDWPGDSEIPMPNYFKMFISALEAARQREDEGK